MKNSKVLTVLVVLVYVFLFVPLIIVTATSFSATEVVAFPPKGFSLRWFMVFFKSKTFMSTLLFSFIIAAMSTVASLIIGIPAAYALSRGSFPFRSPIKSFFLSPTIIPGIVIGFVLFKVLTVSFRFSDFWGLFVGHFIISLPYIIRVVGSSLEGLDIAIEEAAMSLGCTRLSAFFKTVLPNISSGIIGAFILAFINSFNNVPVSRFLTGPGVSTLPVSMMSYVEYTYDPTVSAISVVLMILTILIMLFVEKTIGIGKIT